MKVVERANAISSTMFEYIATVGYNEKGVFLCNNSIVYSIAFDFLFLTLNLIIVVEALQYCR